MAVVTIDGPAGAGKSTIAGRLADRLGWRLLDTGAMYRAVAFAGLRAGVKLTDSVALADLAGRMDVRLVSSRVILDGDDITDAIRATDVTRATRHAADAAGVRRILVTWQRGFAEVEPGVVAEGRDQGTVVFPDALRKFYLTATDKERARRRHAENQARGQHGTLKDVLNQIRARDHQDAARAIAPMRPADDARTIDTTGMDLDAVLALIETDVRAVLARESG